jgi:inorganic pyrophosphatase
MKTVTAIIECPKGINHKLNYNEETRSFKLRKVLPAGLVFPYDFGMIPGTKGEDGDPLDIIILSEITGFPGLEVDCRIVGALQCEQTETNGDTMRNDRYLGVIEQSELYANINDLDDLPSDMISQLEAFFKNYNEQSGKQFKVLKQLNADEAAKQI